MEKNLVERYFRFMELKGKRENTIIQYKSILKKFYDTFEINNDNEEKKLQSITNDDLEDYIEKLIDNEYAASTINLTSAVLQNYYNYLTKNKKNIFKLNPAEGLALVSESVCKKETKVKEVLTLEEVNKILNTTYVRAKGERMYELSSARMRFILALTFTTGARIEEILTLKDSDFEPIQGEKGYFINIPKERVKNKIDKRIPCIGLSYRYYIEYLNERSKLENKDEYIILSNKGKKLSTKDYNEGLEKLTTKAGIEKHITSHCARHTFTGLAHEKGYDEEIIMKLGGWKMTSIMQQSYTRETSYDQRKIELVKNLLSA